MITPDIKIIKHPALLDAALRLNKVGRLQLSSNKLIHLNIDDKYIHELYPLIQDSNIKKPDYFANNKAGAHISVVYPSEGIYRLGNELDTRHEFAVKEFVAAHIGNKIYYALMVECSTLLAIRQKFGLSPKLNFKGYAIGLHITIGYLPVVN